MFEEGNKSTDKDPIAASASKYSCLYCAKYFASLNGLESHMAFHKFSQKEEDGVSTAAIYVQDGDDQRPLAAATDKTSPADVTICCSVCDKTFATIGQLASHSRTHSVQQGDNTRPAFKCMFCTKVLTHPSNLKRHIRTAHFESSDRKVQCCGSGSAHTPKLSTYPDPASCKKNANDTVFDK